MKPIFLIAIATTLSLLTSLDTYAQEEIIEPKTPTWVSNKGYWVVETNKKTPKEAVVYFYNLDDLLVYKEEIKNQKLKMNRKKTLMRLKAALEEAMVKLKAISKYKFLQVIIKSI